LRQERRTIRDFSVIPYDIPRRCTATYYPETNPLVALGSGRGSQQYAGVEVGGDYYRSIERRCGGGGSRVKRPMYRRPLCVGSFFTPL